MTDRRRVEVFSAGCRLCEEAVSLVTRIACDSCEVLILDMREEQVAERAKQLGIETVPAVVIDGELADCCEQGGLTESGLRAAGLGRAL